MVRFGSGKSQVIVRLGWNWSWVGVEFGPSYSQVVARSELWLGQGQINVRLGQVGTGQGWVGVILGSSWGQVKVGSGLGWGSVRV